MCEGLLIKFRRKMRKQNALKMLKINKDKITSKMIKESKMKLRKNKKSLRC